MDLNSRGNKSEGNCQVSENKVPERKFPVIRMENDDCVDKNTPLLVDRGRQ